MAPDRRPAGGAALEGAHRDEFADAVGFVFRGPDASLLYLPDIDSWNAWGRDVAEAVASVDAALVDCGFEIARKGMRFGL